MAATTYDPFTWRLAELEVADDPEPRRQLEEQLLVAEAEELARGRRHLTIVHGEPDGSDDAADIDEFYDVIFEVVKVADWRRVRGSHSWVTVTVAGTHRDVALAVISQLSAGRWALVDSPMPE